MNKFLPGPELTATFIPIPRKYSSPLHKKFLKLERCFEAAEGKPLLRARISKSAQSVYNKLLEKENRV
jgi:hypothetical protein